MVNSVELCSDAYLVCLTHALSTEKEEVMGLLLGEIRDNRVVYICSAYAMRRSDKQPDRVEISPEQLSAAAIEAEQLANKLNRPIQVLGWYHSHPHITVWPSHVDVGTQADYQQMDPNFIGLIFSCFNSAESRNSLQVICFQSVTRVSEQCIEHIELPLRIEAMPQSTLSPMCVSALTHIPHNLIEEERESYTDTHKNNTDLLTAIYNSGVYTQSLTQLLQIIVGPMMQMMEEEIHRNKTQTQRLLAEKEELLAILHNSDSDSEV